MALKKNLPFFLYFLFFLFTKSLAQETIVPDLSSNYVQKLIDTAKKNYPKVKSYQSEINIAKYNISKTNVTFFEAFTVSYIYQPNQVNINPVSPATSYFKGFQAGLFLNLGTLFEHPSLMKTANEQLLIAKNDQAEYFLTLTTDVKKKYYAYVQRVAELKLQTKALQDAEISLKDVKYKFQKGEETFDNFNKAQSELTTREIGKIQSETNLFIAKADLEELIGTKLENVR